MDKQQLLKVLFFSILIKHKVLDTYLHKSKRTAIQILSKNINVEMIMSAFVWGDEYSFWYEISKEWSTVFNLVNNKNFKI